jgi:hypothetical protein
MAARITRAKKKIAAAGIPYSVPRPDELGERLDAVLTVVHLLSTTGHTAPSGEQLVRVELFERALDLARMLVALLPGEREALGLLALLLVHHARAATRDCCAWRSRTARPGTPPRSPRPTGSWSPPSGPVRRAASRCRPRSPRCTPRRRPTTRRTGRSCWRSTTRCCGSGRRRSWP